MEESVFKKLTFVLLFSLVGHLTFASELTKNDLRQLANTVIDPNVSSAEIGPLLSDNLKVKATIGDSTRGFSVFYDKTKYLALLEEADKLEVDELKKLAKIAELKVTSKSSGEFTISAFMKSIKRKVWVTYYAQKEGNQVKIIRIEESV